MSRREGSKVVRVTGRSWGFAGKKEPKGSECERGDSNPHGTRPRDPKSRASTSSATFAPPRGKINPRGEAVQSRGLPGGRQANANRPRAAPRKWRGAGGLTPRAAVPRVPGSGRTARKGVA